MRYALVHSRALDGLLAPAVQVEVQLSNGLPSFTLVGLADTEVKEARERVRAALQQSGFAFPSNQRVTVNLAPADLPKESGRFDLPIALGILAADGQLDIQALAQYEFAGELSLAGELRPVRGALALALALRGASEAAAADHAPSGKGLVLPSASAAIAAQVPGLRVFAAQHLADVVRALVPGEARASLPLARPPCPPAAEAVPPDLAEVKGQATAKRALELAAAGGHHLLMSGPPGSGKSMLAQRLPSLLPALPQAQALAVAALQGLASGEAALPAGSRPFRAPHHSASAVALVGGGSPPRPGEISLAHHGVLFLDELPEFPRSALEALREPLETGTVTIARAARRAQFPARFQCIAAMNPCPCGWLGAPAGVGSKACRCTPEAVQRYQARISGPLRDRFDMACEVLAVPPGQLLGAADGEPSARVAQRVQAAQARQLARQGCLNANLSAAALDEHAQVQAAAAQFLASAAQRLGWSGRGVHRALKLARTAADLAGTSGVDVTHVAEAVQYRRRLE
jgi:magnesium chelatase family protein